MTVGRDPAAEIAALVNRLEVQRAELEVQNAELAVGNDELRRANAALVAARDRYRALHEVAPIPLVTVDHDGTIHDVNQAAEDVLRTPRARLIGGRLGLLAVEAARVAIAGLLADLFTAGRVRGVEVEFEATAADVVVLVLDGVVLDGDGDGDGARARRAVVACVDVTARRQAEEARRALERRVEEGERLQALGVLAGGIAHDFNNLMAVVLGCAELAQDGVAPGTELERSLLDIRNAARQAGKLAQQMLAYAGKASAPARPLELGALIRELEPLVVSSARPTPVVLELPAQLAAVSGDETQLRQVVLDLAINAAEAMAGRPGAITIAAHEEVLSAEAIARLPLAGELAPGPHVVIEVRDQGVGMDAATQARVLEPYFSTKLIGRGLGLAVVHGIVRGHRGALRIASEPGRGTTFWIYLPATVDPPLRARTTSQLLRVWRARGAALVVDDEVDVRRTTERILKRLGFEVVAVASGAEALACFRGRRDEFALVVTDLTMPVMDGLALGAAIRALSPDVPMILITGYGEVRDAGRLFGGALAKPFTVDQLGALVRELVPG